MDNNYYSSLGKLLILVTILMACDVQIQAQMLQRQTVASGGSSVSTNGIAIQQTIGQPYITRTYYDNEVSYLPGFQQSSVFKLEPVKLLTNLNLKVFPNPAVYSVTIESSAVIPIATILVTSQEGRLILNKKTEDFQSCIITCEDWPNGTYLINVSDAQNNSCLSKLIITK